MDLEKLKDDAANARNQYESMVTKRRSAIRCARDSAEENATKFFGILFDGEITRLLREANEKRDAYLEALERHNAQDDNTPYPIGTKMRRKKDVGNGYVPRYVEEIGILELVTRETKIPTNTPYHHRPDVGSFIVRLLKKDGAPSLRFAAFWIFRDGSSNWQPCDPSIKLNPKYLWQIARSEP